MRQSWTDDRMDDLNGKVDRVDDDVRALRGEMRGEFTSVRSEMKAGFDRVDQRLDRLIFLLFGLFATTLVALVSHL